jgi:hypothetical protein
MFKEPVGRFDIRDVKDLAKIAKTINWEKVMEMMLKFDQPSPMMMAINYDLGDLPDIKPKPFPFHRHYRKNIEKMIMTGCFTPKQAEKLISYAKSLRMPKNDFGPAEVME